MWNEYLTQLSRVLEELYPTDEVARRIVVRAGMHPATITFDGAARDIWASILEEAHKHGCVEALVDAARSEYQTYEGWLKVDALKRADQPHTGAAAAGEAPSQPPPVIRSGKRKGWWIALAGSALLVLLTAVLVLIFWPVTINGYILYTNSDKTVAGVGVSLPEAGVASRTNELGFFSVRGPRNSGHIFIHVDGRIIDTPIVNRLGHQYRVVPPIVDPPRLPTANETAKVEALAKNRPSLFRGERADGRPEKLWPIGTTIPVAFLDGNPELKAIVETVATQWTKFANVKFDFDASLDGSDVRVSFKDKFSYSYVGTDARGIAKNSPTIMLAITPTSSDRESVVLHEFGHVLGLIHEYATPAGRARLDWSTIDKTGAKGMIDVNLRVQDDLPSAYETKPFDPDSIMMTHLPSNWFSPPLQVGARTGLSQGDRTFIAMLYPFK